MVHVLFHAYDRFLAAVNACFKLRSCSNITNKCPEIDFFLHSAYLPLLWGAVAAFLASSILLSVQGVAAA